MHKPDSLKRFFVAAPVALVLGTASLPGTAEPLSLTIVHVNDWDRMAGSEGAGGAARIAAVVADERARAEAAGGHAIVTFGGDMISPSLMSGIDKGAHMIALADAVGFEIGVLGNHEFDFGPEVLRQRLSESRMTWLAGNVRYKGKAGFPGTRATTVVEKGGYRIGFLGLVTPETAGISSPGPDVSFAPMADVGAALARELWSAGADLVIALTHDGIGGDLALLGAVKRIDIVLGGHDHLLLARHDGRQAVMKAGSQGRHVGILDLTIDRKEGRDAPFVVWNPGFRLRSTAGIAGDAAVAARVAAYRERLDRDLGSVIGETTTALDTRRASVRTGETAFGNLAADAMRAATRSDAALINGGGIRGDTTYPRRREAHPQAGADRAPLRQQDGEAPPDGRADQAGAGARRQPVGARRRPVSAGLRPRLRLRSPEAPRRAGDPGHGGRQAARPRRDVYARDGGFSRARRRRLRGVPLRGSADRRAVGRVDGGAGDRTHRRRRHGLANDRGAHRPAGVATGCRRSTIDCNEIDAHRVFVCQ